jgi:hypothetical protein
MKITEQEWLNKPEVPQIKGKIIQQYFSSERKYFAGRVDTLIVKDGRIYYGLNVSIESNEEIPESALVSAMERNCYQSNTQYPYKSIIESNQNGTVKLVDIEVHSSCSAAFPSNIEPGNDYLVIYEK